MDAIKKALDRLYNAIVDNRARQEVPPVYHEEMFPLDLPPPPAHIVAVASTPMQTQELVTNVQESDLVKALIHLESGGDDSAIGDKTLVDHAYGPLQIRQPAVDDVNRVFGTAYHAEDCLNNRPLSIWIFNRYMELYATDHRLGRPVTDQDRARIWNGGPNGWRVPATAVYWTTAIRIAQSNSIPIQFA